MLQDRKFFEVTTAADISTKTTMTVELDDELGLPAANIADMAARLIAKRDSSGNGAVLDEKVAISGQTMTITEGSTGLVAGDVYTCELVAGLKATTAITGGS